MSRIEAYVQERVDVIVALPYSVRNKIVLLEDLSSELSLLEPIAGTAFVERAHLPVAAHLRALKESLHVVSH